MDGSELKAYQMTTELVLGALGSDADQGLSQVEARVRLERYGTNELETQKPVPAWKRFLAQFKDMLVLLLLIATAISIAVWLYERDSALPYEAIAILSIVVLNGVLGYLQERRAERAVAALRAMSAAHATVIRDGKRQRVPASQLVPGDVLLIEEGDTIPADARLTYCATLQTAEAALTGESVPISKTTEPIREEAGVGDRYNMLFSGTAATRGRGQAVVTATGMQTEMGRIAGLLQRTQSEPTPLQKELDRTGKRLGLIVLGIAIVMVATIILVEEVRGFTAMVDALILGVALAVAAVPEGLPAVVTLVLSIGVQRMAQRHAIIRRLSAVETLGSATVIASDKTGTLTKNEMTVRTVVTASGRVALSGTGYSPSGEIRRKVTKEADESLRVEVRRALVAADRANNAVLQQQEGRWVVQGDPTEGALIVAARKAGLEAATLDARFGRVAEVPFSSERKLMSTIHSDADKQEDLIVFTKGAPDVLLARCSLELVGAEVKPLTQGRREAIAKANEDLAGHALRTLGLAYRPLEKNELPVAKNVSDGIERNLVFLGLVGMIDPPREEGRDAVARARAAGIRTIMITGDHPKTAASVARELGILTNERVVTGAELEMLTDEGFDQTVQQASVYARVNPEHKLRLVKALQRNGAVVAMTGDGVNDAPALKAADIGVAMGISGTDVSKEAADMVLTDDNFASIVAAVEEGRSIFSNIQKFLRYLFSSNTGEVLTMFFGVLLAKTIGLTPGHEGLVLPLLATQLLWINLVTDGPPALALGVDPASPQVMNRPPRTQGTGVITRRMWYGIIFVGMIMAIGTLLVLDAALPGGLIEGSGEMRYAQTMAFTTLVLFQLFNVFNARSDDRSAFPDLFKNSWLWGAVAFSLGLHMLVIHLPFLQVAFSTVGLSWTDWARCVGVASSVLWLRELDKLIRRGRDRLA
jgi:Ca2+-transporting ATPase